MSVVAAILLVLAVAAALWSTLGFVLARDPFERLHLMTSVSTIAVGALALAIVAGGTTRAGAIKALVVFAITAITSPVTQHMVARAIWVRRHGRWRLPEEGER